ncbi:hypothetical protein FQA39_LY00840 [Lamprigera yunnana]|nr:hypothetical protein FQA39_LY00840 [Lamprigera yunnana]
MTTILFKIRLIKVNYAIIAVFNNIETRSDLFQHTSVRYRSMMYNKQDINIHIQAFTLYSDYHTCRKLIRVLAEMYKLAKNVASHKQLAISYAQQPEQFTQHFPVGFCFRKNTKCDVWAQREIVVEWFTFAKIMERLLNRSNDCLK